MGERYRHDVHSKSRDSIKKAEVESDPAPRAMAIAKPVRALAIVSLVLGFFLLYQVFKSPARINGPGDLEKELPNEPMLEGTRLLAYSIHPI